MIALLISHISFGHSKVNKQTAEKVYADLIEAIGNRLEAPELIVVPSEEAESQAQYYPAYNVIVISEALLTFSDKYAAEAPTVLALILGHELAHHFGNHSLRSAFAANSSLMETATLEAEADHFAIFFAYLAGYPTAGMEARFLRDYYETFDIDITESKHYPALSKRIAIYQNASLSIAELAKVFQAGNYLLLVDEYHAAARCFEFIATKFNSPEVLNNAGVAYLEAAIDLFTPKEFPFLLPTIFEEASNLNREEWRDQNMDREERIQKRRYYLNLAALNFRKASLFKTDNLIAQINLVNVLLLKFIDAKQTDKETVLHLKIKQHIELLELQTTQTRFSSHPKLLKGILSFLEEKPNSITQDHFEKACQKNESGIACQNLQRLNQTPNESQKMIACQEGEAIGSHILVLPQSRAKISTNVMQQAPIKITGYNYQLIVYHQSEEQTKTNQWIIDWMDEYQETPSFKKLYFIDTQSNYKGKSCHQITLGTSKIEMEQKYGTPFQVKNGRHQIYFRYKQSSILFGLKDKQINQMITYYID